MATAQTLAQRRDDSWGKYDFLGVAKYITAVSVALVAISLVIIFAKGLNYGVDFAGGIEMQVQFKGNIEASHVRQFMTDEGFPHAIVQRIGEKNEYLIRVESIEGKSEAETNQYVQDTVNKIKSALASKMSADGAEVRSVETVGPQVGAELRRNGILAAFYCLLLILIFVGLRFDYRYAPGAVFCLFHDAIITVGIYSLFHWEFTTQTMAAVLTIIGYSLNDTIVIFDRIRENQAHFRDKDIYWISNRSINETLSRTVITYLITYMTVASMFFFADGVIREFAIAMLIGMFLGAYSTVYVATPLMLMLDKYQKWKKHQLQTA